jgi:hypothetical protein
MRNWVDYQIVVEPQDVNSFLNGEPTPFNLAKDYKTYGIEDCQVLGVKISAELAKGGPRYTLRRLLGNIEKGACFLDVRIGVDAGKSNGIRCFLLVIPTYKKGVLLGILNHVKGQQDTTLSDAAINMVRHLLKLIEDDEREKRK